MPKNKDFEKIFDSIASSYDSISNSYAVGRRIEFFKKWAKGKCLEVGAGTGEITKALMNEHEMEATDISTAMVKEIIKKLGIKAYASDAEKLPFKNNSFDSIIAAEMIYYLNKPEKFAAESYRILKNKGRLLISSATKITEIYDKIRTVLRKLGFKEMYFDDKNNTFMNTNKLKNMLIKNGFQIKRVERAVILPFKNFDLINRFLEKIPLKYLSSFIYVYAEK